MEENLADLVGAEPVRLYEEARRLELNTIEVDTTMTADDLARRVTESLGL